jgi:hypothetical protein
MDEPGPATWTSVWCGGEALIEDGLADRRKAGLGWWTGGAFSPAGLMKAAALQEGMGNHGHQGMPVQAARRPALEVVEDGRDGDCGVDARCREAS